MKRTIKDYELDSKKVIIRCDLNVPIKDNKILDDTRIISSIKTIKYAIDKNAKVILLSHLGKVKEEKDKDSNSLSVVAKRLSELLKGEVFFSEETSGSNLDKMVDNLKNGQVLLIENTRFEDLKGNRESKCDDNLSKYWAHLGDIFINDAYATSHRNHASVVGISKYLPSGIGFLVEKELKKIDSFLNDKKEPYIAILGGKKVDDKIVLIERLLKECDKVIISGAMSFTFLKVLDYNTGASIISEDNLEFAKKMLNKYKDKIVLPVDFLVLENDKVVEKEIKDFNNDDVGYDIGSKTIKLFIKEIEKAKKCINNGPMGMFEDKRFVKGTKAILKALKINKVKTLIGGGDSASSVNNLGFTSSFYHVSTGGGATLKYLEDRKLIGVEVIDDER